MVADTSVLVSIVFREHDERHWRDALRRERRVLVSAVSAVELIAVAVRHGERDKARAEMTLASPAIEIAPVDAGQARLAREAYWQYGKGRHPAGLNLGDVFSYALAKQRGLPLLFKGDDFARTDVTVAEV